MQTITLYVKTTSCSNGIAVEIESDDNKESLKRKISKLLKIDVKDFELDSNLDNIEQDDDFFIKYSDQLLAKLELERLGIEVSEKNLLKYSEEGNLDEVKLLVIAGVDINAKNNKRCASLHLSIEKSHFEIFKFLVEHGADLNIRNKYSQRPIHYGCSNDHLEICKILIDHKVDINSKDSNGWSPLHYATSVDGFKICKLLIEHGAHLNFENGETPLELAIWNKNRKIIELLRSNKSI